MTYPSNCVFRACPLTWKAPLFEALRFGATSHQALTFLQYTATAVIWFRLATELSYFDMGIAIRPSYRL